MDFFPVDTSAATSFAQRFEPGVHEGTDIFAPRDSAVFAATDGTARNGTDPKGGNVVYLQGHDGRTYYYAHLSHFAYTESPRPVAGGELIGYVGTTGNAQDRPPHLHFGIYVDGAAIDPYPELLGAAPEQVAKQASSTTRSGPAGSPWLWVLIGLAAILSFRRSK